MSATTKHAITVTSDAWDEDSTIRDLVSTLHSQLALVKGKASGLVLTEAKQRYGGKKIVAKLTVTA